MITMILIRLNGLLIRLNGSLIRLNGLAEENIYYIFIQCPLRGSVRSPLPTRLKK